MATNGSTTVRPKDPCRAAVQQATRLIEGAQYALERADELLTALPTDAVTPSVVHLQELLTASRVTRGVVLDLLEFFARLDVDESLVEPLPLPDLTEWLEPNTEVHQ